MVVRALSRSSSTYLVCVRQFIMSLPVDWETLTKKELDHHLSPSQWIKRTLIDAVENFECLIRKGSHTTRECTKLEPDVPCGDKTQSLDLYLPEHQRDDSPVLVCIHGGYWQALSKEDYGLMAMHPAKHGAVVALVGYTVAPVGTLQQMMSEIEQAILFLAKRFPKSRGFYLCGHSCGGQMAAMMLSIDWSRKYGVARDLIKGACFLAGIFDVRPIAKSYVNEPLHLTDDEASEASPINPTNLSEALRLSSHCRVIAVCGEYDAPMFRQMAKDYAKALSDGGLNATCEVIPNMDHFELVERLVEEDYCITKMLLDIMSV